MAIASERQVQTIPTSDVLRLQDLAEPRPRTRTEGTPWTFAGRRWMPSLRPPLPDETTRRDIIG
jgi:hypothetical protein